MPQLKDKLEEILDSGHDTDYCFNGEDEVAVYTYDTNYVLEQLVKFISTEEYKLYSNENL